MHRLDGGLKMLGPAFNLQQWIDSNRHLLKPPVGNKCIVDDQYIIMIVGGPNERTDYHYEDGPEFFYQLEGEMLLRIQENGKVRDIPIRAGEIFYLPPHVPHSPQRMPGSVGLVIERKRLAHEQDALMWYCQQCNGELYQEFFHLTDIENQFKAVFERFYTSLAHRTCNACGHLNHAPARYSAET
jgi:3-hydroxyanthranilate 3,4-dioxygenase